jgi:tRNA1Val (adenine37-N6)-methyltransferase
MQPSPTQSAHPAADELSDDALTGRLRIHQRKRGHRYSLDDVLTARVAAEACPDARRCLDLGCGIGSVLLMLADTLPEAHMLGIEAQEVSYQLAARNVARNALGDRVHVLHGDIRDATLLDAVRGQGFDLVTGTPPYMPVGTATPSPDSQKAHARVELRGGVEVYLAAAGRVLAPEGVCVVCAQTGAEARVERGAELAGLLPIGRIEALAVGDRDAGLFTVHTLVRASSSRRRPLQVAAPFVAREPDGRRSQAAIALRRFFGLDTARTEAPSPRLRARSQVTERSS